MKAKNVTSTNAKGQIVIPKDIRDKLGITPQVPLYVTKKENTVCIQPIHDVITEDKNKKEYLAILDETHGTWQDENWGRHRKKRRKIELEATEKKKQPW